MAKIKISKEEIEKMLIDQLKCEDVTWDKAGNANVELDLDAIKEKEKKVIVKEIHHHDRWGGWPIYISEKPRPKYGGPYWSVSHGSSSMSLSYKS